MKGKDLIGSTFGKLIVIKKFGYSKNKSILYECLCECGNKTICQSSHLIRGTTRSCGCLRKEIAREILKTNSKADSYKNTRIGNIKKEKLLSSNSSGVTGVCYRKSTRKWRARITIQGKEIALGSFITKEEAIKARKDAEELYFKPIIEEFKEIKKN